RGDDLQSKIPLRTENRLMDIGSDLGREIGTDSESATSRRRDQKQYNQPPAISVQAPWTAARCNRLLRPLSSRLALLRKEKHCDTQRSTQEPVKNGVNVDPQPLTLPNNCQISVRLRRSSSSHEGDPEWSPDGIPRKKLKRTYSSRAGLRDPKKTVAAQKCIPWDPRSIAVPCALRYWDQDLPSTKEENLNNHNPVDTERKPEHLEKKSRITGLAGGPSRDSFRRLARSISPLNWMLIDGLYNGLDALLKGTGSSTPLTNGGARSLFSICLQNVPAYIAEEQYVYEEANPDGGVDIASGVYADLEEHGASQLMGWKPLQEIVRAHGIFMIINGIKDGLISVPIARGLVILCLQRQAYKAAECIIQTLLTTAGQLPISLKTLNDFSRRSGWLGFEYRQLALLLRHGILPVEWISSTETVGCWNRVIQSITQNDAYSKDAMILLRTAVLPSNQNVDFVTENQIHILRLRLRAVLPAPKSRIRVGMQMSSQVTTVARDSVSERQPFSNTAASLLTVVLATTLAQSSKVRHECLEAPQPTISLIKRIALEAQLFFELTETSSKTNQQSPIQATCMSLALFADFLFDLFARDASAELPQCRTTWRSILTLSSDFEAADEHFGSFMCAVARCWELAVNKDGFTFLQNLVSRILCISRSKYGISEIKVQTLLNRIVLAAAFEFAEQTNKREHLDWALEVEEDIGHGPTHTNRQTPGKTPARSSHKTYNGYRWEDGISEWIAKTPAVLVLKNTTQRSLADSSSDTKDEAVQTATRTSSPVWVPQSPSLLPKPSMCKKRVVLMQDPAGLRSSRSKESYMHGRFNDGAADELSTPEADRQPPVRRVQSRELGNLSLNTCYGKATKKIRATSLRRPWVPMKRWGRSSLGCGSDGNGSEDELKL
ncbi:hypothetical protein MMC06_006081, partial [Schaereria dolodes]|nr:hypothetical protein [Schaereria dolodes]